MQEICDQNLMAEKNYEVECCGKQNAKFLYDILYDIRSWSNAYCFACVRSESANLEI